MSSLATVLLQKNHPVTNLYLAASLGQWVRLSPDTFLPVLAALSRRYPERSIYQEAIISSLSGFEKQFRETLVKTNGQQNAGMIATLITLSLKNREEGKMNSIFVQARTPIDSRTNGMTIFRGNCASCHGADGDGVEHVGPPLKGSEYVSGPASRLAMIIINGLEGPIHINGQRYAFNNTMPAFADNFSERQIADIVKYLHNAFVTIPVKPITPEEIKKLKSKRTGTLTEKQLLEMAAPEN